MVIKDKRMSNDIPWEVAKNIKIPAQIISSAINLRAGIRTLPLNIPLKSRGTIDIIN